MPKKNSKTFLQKTFDYSVVERHMLRCAILTGGTHTPLNQGRHLVRPIGGDEDEGLCHGLCVTWLRAKRHNKISSATIVRQAQFWEKNVEKLNSVYVGQATQRYFGKTGTHNKFVAMMAHMGLRFVRFTTYKYTKGDLAKSAWHMAGLKLNLHGRYFLFSTGTHAMAATSQLGTSRFFDPNGGEVVFGSPVGLVAFVTLYLGDKLFTTHYFGGYYKGFEVVEFA